jgi:hypothetical protein
MSDPRIQALVALIDAELAVDRTGDMMAYPKTRSLRELREFVRGVGFPQTAEHRLSLTLIPYFCHDADAAGIRWREQDAPLGAFSGPFEIDARVMNRGRGRAELTPAAFRAYLADCDALHEEFSGIRARMHNGED